MRQKIASVSLWFTILSLGASALNFLYYPVIARFLSLSQFGDVQIGVTFIMQAAALFSSLNLVALFLSAGKKNTDSITTRLERVLIIPSIIAALVISIFALPISNALQLHNPSLLYLLAAIFILNIPASTWIGTLQGEGKFIKSGSISLAAAAIKIIVSVILVILGLGAHGAILGILIGTLAIIPLSYFAQDAKTLNIRETFKTPSKQDFALLSKNPTISRLLIALFIMAIISTFDILFAKLFLSPDEAGKFAQFSILAKIPYFFFVPVSVVLFGRFIAQPKKQLKTVVYFSLAIIFVSTIVYLSLPIVAPLLFNLSLSPDETHFIALLLTAFGSLIITSVLLYLLIARGGTSKALLITLFGISMTTVALALFGKTSETIASCFALSQIVIALLTFTVVRYTKDNAN